ncbi:hypothetical protein LXL04_012043 [Taraxacum kok-saghyz]
MEAAKRLCRRTPKRVETLVRPSAATTSKPHSPPLHAISLYETERKQPVLINSGRQLLPPWKLSTETAPPKPATRCFLLGVRLHLDSKRGGSHTEEAATVGRRAVHESTSDG